MRPIFDRLARIALTVVAGKPLNPEAAIASAMRNDPVTINEVNAEPLHQSGVVIGAAGGGIAATLASVAIIADQISRKEFDPATLGPALAAVWMSAWTLYRRIADGLKPVTWLGRLFGKKPS